MNLILEFFTKSLLKFVNFIFLTAIDKTEMAEIDLCESFSATLDVNKLYPSFQSSLGRHHFGKGSVTHSFYETGLHQHHKIKHHMKDREVTCDHNAPEFVNSLSAPLQQQMHLLLWTTSMEYPSLTGCVDV